MSTADITATPAVAASGAAAAAPVSPSAGVAAAGVVPPVAGPNTSLYVGELHPDVTEAMLYELFSQIGPISSIRICRDAITRRSLGYAYVNYLSPLDCDRAIEALNYVPIRGQPCRIMWSQRDPSLRRSGLGNIFIKNLHPTIDNKSLHDTFAAFGNILSCKVVLDHAGNSRGFGFVHFETQEAADTAIAKVNGMLLNGVKVFVGLHQSRRERHSLMDEQKSNFTNIFIKNLDESVSDDELRAAFQPHGEIQNLVIQRDESGKSRGFGFINYTTHEAAHKAVEEMNDKELKGKTLYVGRAQRKSERVEELRRQFEALKMDRQSKFYGVNLYVKNLDEQVDEERLRTEFTPFGTIQSLRLMLDEHQRSRGFGFVCYSSPEEASRAVAEMNGKMIYGKPLYVALAQRRDERRAQLDAHFAHRAQQLRYQALAAGASPAGLGIYQQGPMFYQGMPPAGANVPIVPGMAPARFSSRPPVAPGAGPQGQPRPAYFAGGQQRPPFQPRPYGQRPPMGAQGYPPQQQQQQNGRRPPYHHQQQQQQRFSPGMRNGPRYPMMAPEDFEQQPISTAALAAASPPEQKRILGERLYPMIAAIESVHAGKVTGMLLEMDNADLLHLLETPEVLSQKVHEAVAVLNEHEAKSVKQH